jgi:hypothetical protein
MGISPQLPLPPARTFLKQLAGGATVATIFGRNILVGGTDAFLVDGMAGDAAGLFDDGFRGFGLAWRNR